MDNCQFPNSSQVQLTLMDLNPNFLNHCANKLTRYKPVLIKHDIFQKYDSTKKYDSISLNYVLHCLPGNLSDKETVICNLKQLLSPNGVLFGSTILGKNISPNWLATKLLKLYNKKQIFCNLEDSKEGLQQILANNFASVEITQIGLVALFKVTLS